MDKLNSVNSLIIVVRRMLLSDTALQDDCLLCHDVANMCAYAHACIAV